MSDIIQQHQELNSQRTIIDPRSLWKKLWDCFEKPWIPLAWAGLAAVLVLLWPALFMAVVIVQLVLWLAVVSKPDVLPIHLPMDANKEDQNDPKPGDRGFYKARGSFYIGRIRQRGTEVWVSFKALTQHFLIFGTTGAGKTESIVSYIVNYLAVGSGVAFQDAKAAPKAMIQMATFCRIFGRDDDFRVTNYITGMTSQRRDPAERTSNDAAVFARGAHESNTQLLVSLMPASKGENAIFSERAIALVSAAMPGLTDLRDLGQLQIDPGLIRRYMGFNQFCELYRNNSISKRARDALQAYLESLPGYDERKDIREQPEEVTRQFGFAQAYFTRTLASLSDTYGHIYLVGQGEIDYQDAVLNGRILMTLLPSMEKAGDELANLGKIVLTATRNGMVVGLGSVFEGSADDIVHNLPTNSDIPYGIMNDENAYMLVEGQEMTNAQGRGLGFGVMTGTQDVSGMLLSIEKTTKQIMANSAFKQFMFLDDEDTTKLAVELSGEAQVLTRTRYEINGELGNYYASQDATVERRYRLNATAIKKRGLGQAYITYQGRVHDVQVFNHGINEKGDDPLRRYISHWYSVRMAKVRVPNEQALKRLIKLSPRPEWQDMMLMINDTSRAMLKEMCTFFSSMIAINRIARQYADNAKMLDLSLEVIGSRKLLEQTYEPPVGLLKDICEHAPSNYRATSLLLAHLLNNHTTEQTALLKMAQEAGLDAPLDGMEDLPFFDDDDSGGGSGGGLGARNAPQDEPAPATAEFSDDPLADYLSASEHTIGSTAQHDDERDVAGDNNHGHAADSTAPAPRALSPLAGAVERNLANMPWMASVVEYGQVQAALVETELFFDENPTRATERVNAALGDMAARLTYPETPMPKQPLSIDQARELMSPFIAKR